MIEGSERHLYSRNATVFAKFRHGVILEQGVRVSVAGQVAGVIDLAERSLLKIDGTFAPAGGSVVEGAVHVDGVLIGDPGVIRYGPRGLVTLAVGTVQLIDEQELFFDEHGSIRPLDRGRDLPVRPVPSKRWAYIGGSYELVDLTA